MTDDIWFHRPSMNNSGNTCEDCKHCVILEDRSEDMRPPAAYCSNGHIIVNVDIMEWTPLKSCGEWEEGDPNFF